MKLPPEIDQITFDWLECETCNPPLGFLPINGWRIDDGSDYQCYWGLYWPIACEQSEPLLVSKWLTDYSIRPSFSSLSAFLRCVRAADDTWNGEPTISDDPDSPVALYNVALDDVDVGSVDLAISRLKNAVGRLPEFGCAQDLLGTLYRRMGDHEASALATLQAMISPLSLGGASEQAARRLARMQVCPESMVRDPVWTSRSLLTYKFGDTKTNDQYGVLQSCIERYIEIADSRRALTLMQTYGELMSRETVSFRERYGFDPSAWVSRQAEVAKELGVNRNVRTLRDGAPS